jgi:hypothetical protein
MLAHRDFDASTDCSSTATDPPPDAQVWTQYQQKIQLVCIASAFPYIYGLDDYNRYQEDIYRYWGLEPNHQKYVCVTIPRRHGKTQASAVGCVASRVALSRLTLAYRSGARWPWRVSICSPTTASSC